MCWSTGFIFMKLFAGVLEPIVIAGMRGAIAAAALGIFLLTLHHSLVPKGEERVQWLVVGTFNGWLPNFLTAYAVTEIPAALAAMIQASGPLIVAVLAHLAFSSERLTMRRALGVLVGLVGMAVLVGPAALPGGQVSLLGVAAMIATAASYATCTIYIRAIRGADATRLAYGQQLIAGVVALPLAFFFAGPMAFAPVANQAPMLIALGIVATAIPITLWMRLAHAAGPTIASLNGYLIPVWTTLFAVTLLGEVIGWREMAGATIILAGVWLVTASRR